MRCFSDSAQLMMMRGRSVVSSSFLIIKNRPAGVERDIISAFSVYIGLLRFSADSSIGPFAPISVERAATQRPRLGAGSCAFFGGGDGGHILPTQRITLEEDTYETF